MTLDDARRILGLEAGEDPATHLKDFSEARDRIAELVRTAPNPVIAARYQAGLSEFDAALNVVRVHLAAPEINPVVPAAEAASVPVETPEIEEGEPAITPVESVPAAQPDPVPVAETTAPVILEPLAPAEPATPVEAAIPPVVTALPEPELPAPTATAPTQNLPIDLATPTTKLAPAPAAVVSTPAPAPSPRRGGSGFMVTLLILLLLGVGGGYAWLRMEQEKRLSRTGDIAELEKQGAKFVEDRLWDEARQVQAKIEGIDPGSDVAASLRRGIEAGMSEESQQFIQHWNDRALADFEANHFDAAAEALREVFSKEPKNAQALELQGKIESARKAAAFRTAKESIVAKSQAKDWDGVLKEIAALQAAGNLDAAQTAELAKLSTDARTGKQEAEDRYLKARDFYARAKERDTGKYDAQGLELAREAQALAPNDAEIKALFEKFASYVRTLHVPGDFATVAEALADAHDRDRVVIGEGAWQGPLVVNVAVEIQGAGADKTIITCAAADGSVLTVGPAAKGARVSGMTFRHTSLDAAAERFSAVLVRGGQASFANCHFLEGAGHGLALIAGGRGSASHCRFSSNGWDGVSASGAGSSLEVTDSDVTNNIEHGLDLWDGATGTLTGNRCDGNSRNGIQVDAGAGQVAVTGNQLRNNREFGLVLTRAASGKVANNTLTGNLLGGIMVRTEASKVAVAGNKIQSDTCPGLALEKGVSRDAYAGNQITSAVPANPTVIENVDFNAQPAPEPEVVPAPEPMPAPAPAPAPKPQKKKK